MRITLFRAFPDSYRQSMALYANCLEKSIRALLFPPDQIQNYFPENLSLKPGLARYWSQYVRYPLSALRAQGDINHITDHAYGHLAWTLNPSKTVVTVHDCIALKTRPGPVQQYNLGGIRRAAHVLCDSEATRKKFLTLSGYPERQTSTIYLGVGEEFFGQAPPVQPFDRLGIPPGRYILHIGHTMAYKNIPGLLKAFSLLTRDPNGSDLRLLRIGNPFSRDQAGMIREMGLENRVVQRGSVPSDQLLDVYHCADLLLFPSFDEGFGFPVLEAMASGLPVVASNRGSLPEITGDAAILVDPSNHEALAEAAASVLSDSGLRAQLRQRGLERARLFRWAETARRTLELYRRVSQR